MQPRHTQFAQLAIVALLLGAGAVVAYVVSTQPSSPAAPPPTFATALDGLVKHLLCDWFVKPV